jgi:hypothetical protein
MLVATQTEDVDPRQGELLQRKVRALISKLRLLSQCPEAPPVKLLQCVVEVAPGDGERRENATTLWRL